MELRKVKEPVNLIRMQGGSSVCSFKRKRDVESESSKSSSPEEVKQKSPMKDKQSSSISKRSKTSSSTNGIVSSGGTAGSTDSTSTLHACSLNTPDTTVKGLYVDNQNRYLIVQRLSKISGRNGVVVSYIIKEEESEVERKLNLKDMWAEMDWLEPGTLVNIVGVTADENNCFVVERLQGYLVLEPDRLVSVTSVISQLYCERKTALSRFYIGGDSAVTFRGVVAHELICKAMADRLDDSESLMKEVKAICGRPQMLERAYGIGMNDDELDKIKGDVVQWVLRFMRQRFLGKGPGGTKPDPKYQNFKFKTVLGIEDNIWNPAFGMKGKIDATVQIERDSKLKVVPLEFKTGSTKSQKRQMIKADHVGQVTLYTLMMNIKFGTVEEALLYYISDDSLSLHPPRTLELQQLIMKRNKFIRNTVLSNGQFVNLPRPDGIDYDFKCKSCELKSVCTSEIRKKDIPEEHQLPTEKKLLESCKLSDTELNFFNDWLEVINAETEEVEKKYNDKSLWTKSPESRETAGTCITDLKILGECLPWIDGSGKTGYLVSLAKRSKSQTTPTTPIGLHVDDFVALSSNVEVCINYGVIVIVRGDEITLSLDQPLHTEYKTADFIYSVDKINTTSPIASQYGYLAKLMEDTPEAQRLREYIILSKQPKFGKLAIPDSHIMGILDDLNVEQKRVVAKSLVTDSFLFVKGTPGSGKTTTIVSLLRALVHTGKTVLIVSYTGTALENILLKYKKHDTNFIKISTSGRSDVNLSNFTTRELSKSMTSISEMVQQYNKPVVGTTLLSLKHSIFQVRRFDYCIIDEASQALPTAVFGALCLCDKYIVFGDPNQLPPVLQSSLVKSRNICDNFFSLMASPVSTIKLNIQYRMNGTITKLANALMYADQMKCANVEQEKGYIKLPESDIRSFLLNKVVSIPARKVLCHTVSKKLKRAVMFLDTTDVPAFETRMEETIWNEAETYVVISSVRAFIESKLDPPSVGIIAPYRGQVNQLRSALKNMEDQIYHQIEVNTVDQYQGREMEVIICSFTKSLPKDSSFFENTEGNGAVKEGILEDIRRLNVAITRARRKLVMIGNRNTLQQYTPFQKLFGILEEDQIHKLTIHEICGLRKLANPQSPPPTCEFCNH